MSVKIRSRQVGDVNIFDVAGRITLGEEAGTLREALRDAIGKNQKKVLLNLAEVSYIDSSGLMELVDALASIGKSGGQLKLLNLTRRVQDLLQITKLRGMFEVHDDEAAAVASFK